MSCCLDINQIDRALGNCFDSGPIGSIVSCVEGILEETVNTVEYLGREIKLFLEENLPREVSHITFIFLKNLPLIIADIALLGVPSKVLFVTCLLFPQMGEEESLHISQFFGAMSIYYLGTSILEVAVGDAFKGLILGGLHFIFASSFIDKEINRIHESVISSSSSFSVG